MRSAPAIEAAAAELRLQKTIADERVAAIMAEHRPRRGRGHTYRQQVE
jgi:hypothetical protein